MLTCGNCASVVRLSGEVKKCSDWCWSERRLACTARPTSSRAFFILRDRHPVLLLKERMALHRIAVFGESICLEDKESIERNRGTGKQACNNGHV